MGTAAALVALAFAPVTAAYASSAITVSCSSGASGLVGAIHAANTAGGGTITLASGCTYTLTEPDNTNTMFGANGLPVAQTITFTTKTPLVCTVNGTKVTLVSVGTCTIQANQAGNAIYSPAPSMTRSFKVSRA